MLESFTSPLRRAAEAVANFGQLMITGGGEKLAKFSKPPEHKAGVSATALGVLLVLFIGLGALECSWQLACRREAEGPFLPKAMEALGFCNR